MFDQFAVIERFSGVCFACHQYVLRLFVVQHVLVRSVGYAKYVWRVVGSAFELVPVVMLEVYTKNMNVLNGRGSVTAE